jgi:DNA invertase Pin-like site-specific DNA recombinase
MQDHKQDRQLAELFDNALDDNMQEVQPQEAYKAKFGQESDGSNFTTLTPDNKHHAHFDNARFPNEIYNAVMVNGDTTKLPANDISPDALETGKIVFEHNNQLAASGQQSAGKAFIYARSSRTNDISIETQRKVCLQYAAVHKLELLPFGYQSDNNVSARNMGNLKLKHQLGFWQEQIPDGSHIIIYSVDRLSRHLVKGMQFLDEMAARCIRIHFVTHELVFHSGISAAGRAMIQQELQSAEKFSNIASEKVRTTMARLRQEGNVFGRAPYGYKHTKIGNIRKRTPDNKEQQNIRKIQSQYSYIMDNWKNNPDTAELRYSKINMLRTILRWCNRNGMKYRHQQNYTTSQIRNIIEIEVNNN